MGAYLTAPITDKESSDGTCDRLSYGASSMQGWRRTQEDAHNCIIDIEQGCSFFAVYDGHGGAEVAKYCAIHLPDFILSRPEYKNGNIPQALEDAFLEFDATLIKPEVISELKQIAGLSEASESDDNAEKLRLEARMPLEDLLARYHGLHGKVAPHLQDYNENPKSPMLRAKTDAKIKISSSVPDDGVVENTEDSCNNAEASAEEEGGPCDSVRSSSNNRIVNGKEDDENDNDKQNTCDSTTDDLNLPIKKFGKINQESVVSDTSEAEVVDSKSAKRKDNGAISSSDNKITSVCDSEVSESSACDTSDAVANTSQANSSCYLDEEDANGADSSSRKRVTVKIYADSSESSEDDEDYGLSESGEGTDEDDDDEEDDSGDKGEDGEDEEDEEDEDYERAEVEICDKEEPGSESGCTAVVAILKGDMLYVANAGDSRCVVSRQGQAVDMSIDHKPEDKLEKTRIENAGGEVTLDGRVNGGLNLSRAIGDHAYKQNSELGPKEQMITALPDVKTLKLDPSQDKFMVLACDGIWNHMSSQEVVDFVQKRMTKEDVKLSSLCEELFDNCLAPSTDGDGTGCDNMTCIIVKFHDLMALPISKKRRYPDSEGEDDQLSGSSKKRKECTEDKTT